MASGLGGSVGAAAAQGLESGFGLGLKMRAMERREKDDARRRELQDEDRVYLRQERSRKQENETHDRALKALDAQRDTLKVEGEGYGQQYGLDVPEDVASDYAARASKVARMRRELLEKDYAHLVERRTQEMADWRSRLQTGQVDIGQVPDRDLYQVIEAAGRRDPRDFLGDKGAASRVSQAVTDAMTGIETGNEQMMLRGVNVLLEPELQVGVGQDSPHGGQIVGKEIIKLIPHPQKPGEFLPVVRVYVKREGGKAGDGRKDGATGYYDAPITENRSTDPNDPVKSISVEAAMQRAAQMQTLSTLLERPDIRAKLERGEAEAKRDPQHRRYLHALFSMGAKMPEKKLEWKSVTAGGAAVAIDPRTGKEISRIEGPAKTERGTGLAGQIAAIEGYAAKHGISEQEAAKRLRGYGLMRAEPRVPSGRGPAAKAPSAAEMKRIADEAETDTARRAGLRREKGQWVTSNGRPASAEMLGMLARVRAAALAHAEKSVQAGQRPSVVEASEAARAEAGAALEPKAPSRFTPGQVYVNAKGQRAKYGGTDAAGKDIWMRAQ